MVKVYYSLYDRMLSIERLRQGFRKVKFAKGAAGIDGQTIADFEESLDDNLTMLVQELREKSYRPQPVKRVEIPKAGGGVRKLGIPTVRDRVVQQALLEILQPIFDPDFHPSSFGYRPGRSCHQAITKAAMFIRTYDLKWVVDMDLSKCFDTLDHEIIIHSFRRRIADGSVLALLRRFLQAGVMTGEGWQSSETGSPQGGVISPLIANVYLDAFDQFMKGRNHRIVRYADDILVLCGSQSAAENAGRQAALYLENELKLTINKEKTHLVHSEEGVKFLGVVVRTVRTVIQEKKIRDLKKKVRGITRRNSPVNLMKVIEDLNPVLRGFANYFRIANCTGLLRDLAKWVRRRLRAKQLRLWKKPIQLIRRLRHLGYPGDFPFITMNSWKNSASEMVHKALPNKYFKELGLYDLSQVRTGIRVSLT